MLGTELVKVVTMLWRGQVRRLECFRLRQQRMGASAQSTIQSIDEAGMGIQQVSKRVRQEAMRGWGWKCVVVVVWHVYRGEQMLQKKKRSNRSDSDAPTRHFDDW